MAKRLQTSDDAASASRARACLQRYINDGLEDPELVDPSDEGAESNPAQPVEDDELTDVRGCLQRYYELRRD